MTERELLHRYKTSGDVHALQALVLMHRPFVKFVANKYRHDPDNYADMVQEGILGLIHAINKFDLNRPVKLISYAVYWIREYISAYLRFQYKVTPIEFTDSLEDQSAGPEDLAIVGDLHHRVQEATHKVLSTADTREIEIFEARYKQVEEVSFAELGKRYGISRQRAHEISNITLDKIRKNL